MEVSNKTKIGAFLIAFTIVGLMALYVQEFHWLGNTFYAKKLIFWSLGFGLLSGVGLGKYWTRNIADSYDRMRLWILVIFVITLFSPYIGSLTNRLLSFEEAISEEFIFFTEKPIADLEIVSTEKARPEAYFVFFMKNGTLERAKTRKRLFEGTEKGAKIRLPVKRGLYGFDIVCLD